MMLAVIRVRGGFKIKKAFKDTLQMLRLNQNHHLVLLDDSPINRGMIMKVEPFITWGPINDETLKLLIEKRGRYPGHKRVEAKDVAKVVKDLSKINKVFRLSPPKGGWPTGNIKLRYPRGAVGPRGEEINSLIKHMI